MSVLPLRYYGDPILRKRAKEVVAFDEETKKFIQDLIATVHAHPAAGLAAPQVGQSLRIFVARKVYVSPDGHYEYTDVDTYVNPKVTVLGDEQEEEEEGCLSIPGVREKITRPKRVYVEALDADGHPFSRDLKGYEARIILHENDHINGVLIIDRLDPKIRKQIDPLLRSIKKRSINTSQAQRQHRI